MLKALDMVQMRVFGTLCFAFLLICSTTAWCQDPTLEGKVIDSRGVPVLGASISISKTDASGIIAFSQTNDAGMFKVILPDFSKEYQIRILKFSPVKFIVCELSF